MHNSLSVKVKEISEEVLYTCDPITSVTSKDIDILKKMASMNPGHRIRLCTHLSPEDDCHNMLITLVKGCYISPHKHRDKAESFHIIEGRLRVVIFDDMGNIKRVINMGDYSSGETFFYRLSEDSFHTVIPLSETVVFHESTSGPFDIQNTTYPDWDFSHSDLQKIDPTGSLLSSSPEALI
jgi:cupin fold WbuC family metalloprotein